MVPVGSEALTLAKACPTTTDAVIGFKLPVVIAEVIKLLTAATAALFVRPI